ncbi:MAG: universal stress protein [Anaerolineae bacterium]
MADLELLIATNGFEGSWPAIEYGTWLAGMLKARVSLLGVTERVPPAPIDDHHPLEEIFGRAVALFQEKGVSYRLEVEIGNAEEVIPRKANARNCIAVLGPLGRPPLRRLFLGRSIYHLMEQIINPILYVPQVKLPLQKMLVCMGGLGYEVTAEHLAIRLAVKSGARVTLLHVVPPVDLDYPTARTMREQWQHLLETDTPPGRALRQALEATKQAGVHATVRLRHGHVVEEILSEIKEGDYQLVCMGSPYSGHSLRQLYAPNVTGEVAEMAHCPVLTARYVQKEIIVED